MKTEVENDEGSSLGIGIGIGIGIGGDETAVLERQLVDMTTPNIQPFVRTHVS